MLPREHGRTWDAMSGPSVDAVDVCFYELPNLQAVRPEFVRLAGEVAPVGCQSRRAAEAPAIFFRERIEGGFWRPC